MLRSVEDFPCVQDCVGGDDYWAGCQNLLLDDGVYVTLVGPLRHGGEGNVSVGTAINTQVYVCVCVCAYCHIRMRGRRDCEVLGI